MTFVFYLFLWAGLLLRLFCIGGIRRGSSWRARASLEDGSTGIETPVETEVVAQNTKDGEEGLRNVDRGLISSYKGADSLSHIFRTAELGKLFRHRLLSFLIFQLFCQTFYIWHAMSLV